MRQVTSCQRRDFVDMPGGDYYTRPQEELCQVNGPNCSRIPSNRIYCRTEGRGVLTCAPCHADWRRRATGNEIQGLQDKCPLCADWNGVTGPPRVPVEQTPATSITGPASNAIDAAMHAEGLLVDVRRKVLQRLSRDNPWLMKTGLESEIGFGVGITSGNAKIERTDLS